MADVVAIYTRVSREDLEEPAMIYPKLFRYRRVDVDKVAAAPFAGRAGRI